MSIGEGLGKLFATINQSVKISKLTIHSGFEVPFSRYWKLGEHFPGVLVLTKLPVALTPRRET